MAQGKHIGKLVLSMCDSQTLPVLASARPDAGVPVAYGAGAPQRSHLEASPSTLLHGATDDSAAKNDKRKMLHPRPQLQTVFRAPETQTETIVADTWRRPSRHRLGWRRRQFFDLNGDSLLAAQLMSRLYNSLQVKLPLSVIFESPTVSGLAKQLDAARRSTAELQTAPTAAVSDDEEEGEL